MKGFLCCLVLLVLLLLIIAPAARASDPPAAYLVSPDDGNMSSSNNITFSCNATDDQGILRISLYHDINGSFSLHETKRIMELDKDQNTTLLCRFDGNYICEDGETGDYSSTGFVSSMFGSGVMVNDTDTLRYQTSGNMDFYRGTVEFWIKLGFDPSTGQGWLFSTGDAYQNDMQMHISSQTLYYDYWDDYGYVTSATFDVSGWKQNEWHHITGIWDIQNDVGSGYVIDLFVDGSNSSVTFEYTDFGDIGTTGQYLYIGSFADGTNQADSVFDEFRISDIPRTESEINASYMKGSGDHRNESANWTISGVSDGTYIWNCLVYDNESQFSWGSQNFSLIVDAHSPPVVSNVTLSPGSEHDLDPGVVINVTAEISDASNVSFAIFQYKYDVDWINVTMEHENRSLWNATFTTIGSERVYHYRIWSNDTLGNSNTSQEWAVNVTWDYTWSRDPSFINSYGAVNTVDNVGIVRINNTGDDTLIITLSDDWPILDVYYNTTSQFSIPSGAVRDINVTAKYASQDSVNNMTINISAEPSAPSETASPPCQITTVTMNSYTGGAYLYAEITESPTSVYQSQTTNLTATVKNIGNETAENVWFNWTLPSGWSVSSGNASRFIGNMSPQSPVNSSSLVVTVTSSAHAGVSIICINATGSTGSNGSDCKNIAVTCSSTDGICGSGCTYLNDNDCTVPVTGGGSTTVVTAEAAILDYGILILPHKRFDIIRGESRTFQFRVKNPSNRTVLKNVTLTISNYPRTLATIIPDRLEIGYGETKVFSVNITAPDYMSYGKKTLIFRVSAAVLAGSGQEAVTVSNETSVDMLIHSRWEHHTQEMLDMARNNIEWLKSMGVDTSGLESLLMKAEEYATESRYDEAKSTLDMILDSCRRANNSISMIFQVNQSIETARFFGISVPHTEMFRDLAFSALRRGDFARAEERSRNAIMAYGIEAAGMVSLIGFVYENWALLTAMIVISAASAIILMKRIKLRLIDRKIKSLAKEETAAEKLIERLQKQRFQTGLKAKEYLSGNEYKTVILEHEKRISRIKRMEVELASKRIRLISKNPLACFEEQKKHIERMIRNIQKQYFEFGAMSKDLYERTLKGLTLELAEVNKNIAAERSKRTGFRAFRNLFFAALVSLILVSSVPVFAQGVTYGQALASIKNAERIIAEMQELGLGTSYANDTLAEAKSILRIGYPEAAKSLADRIPEIKETAINLSQEIDTTEAELLESERTGINVTSARYVFERVLEAFAREDYSETRSLLKRTSNIIDEMRSKAALKGLSRDIFSSAWLFFARQWQFILAFVSVSTLAGWASLGKYFTARNRKRIKALKREINSITRMMQDTQRKYFQEFSIDKKGYEAVMKEGRERILKMRREIISLEDSLKRSGRRKAALFKQTLRTFK